MTQNTQVHLKTFPHIMQTHVQNLIAGFICYLLHLYRVVCHDYYCNMLDILLVFESIIPTLASLPSQVRPQVSANPSQVLTL